MARILRRRFEGGGVRVAGVIRAHGGRWFAPLGDFDAPSEGAPYDVSGHPLRLQSIVEGRVVAASRSELAARVAPDLAAVAGVEDALLRLWADVTGPVTRATGPSMETLISEVALLRPGGPALRTMLTHHLAAGTVPDDTEAALILLAVHDPARRDHICWGIRRNGAAGHVRLWSDLVRRAPEQLVADAGAILALAAWLQGEGALAWCAVDRCLADRADHAFGRLMAELLERAVAPSDEWRTRFPSGIAG
jgi:hypothetical protein